MEQMSCTKKEEPDEDANENTGGETMVKINGEDRNLAGMTLTQYLAGTNYNPKRIAVERNGEIVPKARYEETIFQDGDHIEVVSFVGGG